MEFAFPARSAQENLLPHICHAGTPHRWTYWPSQGTRHGATYWPSSPGMVQVRSIRSHARTRVARRNGRDFGTGRFKHDPAIPGTAKKKSQDTSWHNLRAPLFRGPRLTIEHTTPVSPLPLFTMLVCVGVLPRLRKKSPFLFVRCGVALVPTLDLGERGAVHVLFAWILLAGDGLPHVLLENWCGDFFFAVPGLQKV